MAPSKPAHNKQSRWDVARGRAAGTDRPHTCSVGYGHPSGAALSEFGGGV